MIREVNILDNNKSPFDYITELDNFQNGKTYQFADDINIIIGENGSGKSTLLKLISEYMLCNDNMVSHCYNELLSYKNLFIDNIFGDEIEKVSMNDGIEIKADYLGVVYRYMAQIEMKKDEILSSSENFFSYLSNTKSSTGESVINSLNNLFNFSFSNRRIQFPLEELDRLAKKSNTLWRERLERLIDYYKRNAIKITKEEFRYTFLLDEIDRNLDIKNIESIYSVLSYRKPYTQVIAVIHNPILIYKLSKLDYINFIELTDGYLDSIKNIMENL